MCKFVNETIHLNNCRYSGCFDIARHEGREKVFFLLPTVCLFSSVQFL